jgi:hypothetical protein
MRLDDNYSVPPSPPTFATEEGTARPPRRIGLRFTSNVVGTLFLVTDIICFIVSAPITLAAYSVVRPSF